MTENKKEYVIVDEDGDEATVTFKHRPCHCINNNCNDDEILVRDICGDEYSVQVPSEITPYLEGVFKGTDKVRND